MDEEITLSQLETWKLLAEEQDWDAIRRLIDYYQRPDTKNMELERHYLQLGASLNEPYCLYRVVVDRAAEFVPIRLSDEELSLLERSAKQGYAPAADLLCTYVVEQRLYSWGARALSIAEAALAKEPLRKGVLQGVGSLLLDPGYGCYNYQRGFDYLYNAGLNGCGKAGCEALAMLYNDTQSVDLTPAYNLMDALEELCPDFVGFMRILFGQWCGVFTEFDSSLQERAEQGWPYHALLGAYCNLFGIGQEPDFKQARHYMDMAPGLTELLEVYYHGMQSEASDKLLYMANLLDLLVPRGVRFAASTKASLLLGRADDGASHKEEILRLIKQAQSEADPMGWGLLAYIHHYGLLGFAQDEVLATHEGVHALQVGYCPLAMHVLFAAGSEADRDYVEFYHFRNYYSRLIDAVYPLKEEMAILYHDALHGHDQEQFRSKEATIGKRLLVQGCFRLLV